MGETDKIRISEEFQDLIFGFKARCYAKGIQAPTTPKVTKIIAEYIDEEKLFENGYAKIKRK